ncbi:amidase family protein [Gordonia sp. FQ]|uniref:amidase family protein n=1 Tax=Gordonia sp. FQ TaxID=3446634 RepID=UPI003F83B531
MSFTVNANTSSADLRAAYRAGDTTPVDVLDQTLARADAVSGELNCFAYLNTDEAMRQAEASAKRWAAGAPLSDLDGLPISIKDSVASVGTPWRHGTAPNVALPMSTFDAPPAARLKEAGALIFAKTAMPDFGMLASGVSSLYGIVRNPWNTSMNTGGSSAGAGASLAAGIGSMSVGSDIAGSVRLPAAHCGLVALKPTQGRIPHLAPSNVRSAGPMARTVREAAELFAVISRPDSRDFSSLAPDGEPPAGPLDDAAVAGLRVGVMCDMGYGFAAHPQVVATVEAAAELLAAAGAKVTRLGPVFDDDPYLALDRLFAVRARAEWAAFDEEGRARVLPEVVEWCAQADGFDTVRHEEDQNSVARSAMRFAAAHEPFDIVLSPVLPGLGHRAEMVGLDSHAPLGHCSFTCWYNQSGQPAAAIGFGIAQGVPVAVQVAGPRFTDQRVLAVSEWLEARRSAEFVWPEQPRRAAALSPGFFARGYTEGDYA